MKTYLLTSAAVLLAASFTVANAQQGASDRNQAPAASARQQSEGSVDTGGAGSRTRESGTAGHRASERTRQPSTTGAASSDTGRQPSADRSSSRQEPASGSAEQDKSSVSDETKSNRARNRDSQDRARERSSSRERRDTQNRRQSRDERRRDAGHDRSASDRNARDRSTTGQAVNQDRRNADTQRSRDSSDRASRRDREDRDRTAGRNDGTRNAAVSLSAEQRTRVTARFSDRIDRLNVRALSRPSFSVSVGTVIPRSVRLYDVPDDVIAIYPRFRGDKFVLVEDEIVVIEPGSRRILATLPRSGGRSVTTGSAVHSDHRIRVSADDRQTIRTVVLRDRSCHEEFRLDFSIGIPLPRSVHVCDFPDTLVSEVPAIRSYRYVVRGDDVVVVDPDESRIVEVID
jgi:hypothetical protein